MDSLALFFCFSADLQKAVESENYALAAELRDTVAKLEVPKLRRASYVSFCDIV
jgi:hypothetical protein